MGHVTFMILLGLPMEYLGPYLGHPSMTSPPSHVFGKNRIFAKKRWKLIPKNGRVPEGGGLLGFTTQVSHQTFTENMILK